MLQPNRISLANLPTPLIPLERLGRELGGAALWIKRDDLTGLEVSGNKVRKLEYVAADAIARGCDTLVTEGTCQSNHCRATAAVCARLGLQSVLLFRPLPPAEIQGNHLLDLLFGAQTRCYTREELKANKQQILDGVLDELRAAGRRPRWTPAGASEPLGCWGYISAMAELGSQLRDAGSGECDVVVAVSSAGTYAGALLGKLMHRLDGVEFWGVPVSDDVAYHTAEIGKLCRAAIAEFDLPVQFDDSLMKFVPGYVGEGYAIPYPEAIEAVRLLARSEAIVLDPVYTAKAFCGLLDAVRARRWGFERPVVFLHTGGLFSNFAWPGRLL